MPEERADLVRRFRRQDVFELASLLLNFGLAVHGQRIGKEALREAVAANDVGGAFAPVDSELNDCRSVADRDAARFESVVAGIHERLVIVRHRRMRRRFH